MKNLFLIITASLFFACNSGNNTTTAPANETMPDEAAIKTAVDNAYASLSISNGKKPNADSFKSCFIPQAQLINFIADTAQILSIDNFVKAFSNFIETSKVNYYKEVEIYGKTDQFGNIAQRISSYKTFANNPDVVSERGVNSFQLIKTPNGWKVSSIIWDMEDKSLPIPKYYLPK